MHALGKDEEYIKKAIDAGLETLGFSDHTPYPFNNGYVSGVRMTVAGMDEYFDSLLALRHKYRDYIDIRIGFETEYYPAFFEDLIREYRRHPLDYIIYAGHNVENESLPDCFVAFERTADESRLVRYVNNTLAAMRTGRFTYLAHPDLMDFVGDDGFYREQMGRIILEAKEMNMPLEYNLLGVRGKRRYPYTPFWEEVARLGATAVLGCDAHQPNHVADKNEINEAQRFADRMGINLIDEVKLINPIK